jgi:hypothetical protein
MAGEARDYVKQVHGQTGYWLNYPPAQPLRLGDIVIRHGGIWIRIGNVTDRGVTIDTLIDESLAGTPWVSSSGSGVRWETSLTADPGAFKYLLPGQAGVKVSLEKGNKYLLSLNGARFHSIASIDKFWDDVRSRYSIWTWNRHRKLVTSICTAESGTFLGSGSSTATYELLADAEANVQGMNLGKLSANFKLVSTYSSNETFAGLAKVSPVFRLHKVTLLGNVDAAALDDDPENPPTEQTTLTVDDTDSDSED